MNALFTDKLAPTFPTEYHRGATGFSKPLNLENSITCFGDKMPCVKEKNMAKYRERVEIGNNEAKWASGNTRNDLHLSIGQILLESGVLKPKEDERYMPTVREFVEKDYWDAYVLHLKPKTIENYKMMLKYNIFPFLGDMRMDEVDVSTIQRFYNWMASASKHGRRKDINKRSIERIGGFASRIFRVAREQKLIDDTPFKHTLLTIRAEEAGHHKPLPDTEIVRIKQLIPSLANSQERVYMGMLAYTGMRPQEVLGMRWEDVHIEARYCEVKRTVTFPGTNRAHVSDGGKTVNACRTVILPMPLIAILESAENKNGFLIGGEYPPCYSKLAHMRKRAFTNLKIEGYSDYDFRTTFATQLCEMGITTKGVADLMGHADSRMVETVYARRRHAGVMKHSELINAMNDFTVS